MADDSWYADRREQRSDATTGKAWQKPSARYGTDDHGRRVRMYQCQFCQDEGAVSLPKWRDDETDEDLLGMDADYMGAKYAYPCPVCRGMEFGLSGNPLQRRHKGRLDRWRSARRRQLEQQRADDEEGKPFPFSPGAVAALGIGKDMPALTPMQQSEIALEVRDAQN